MLTKIHTNNLSLASLITLLTLICGVAALLFSYLSLHTMHVAQKDNENRYQTYLLVDQLRLSSDQLTLMARGYAVTGSKKYLQFFKEILAIRNGSKPRPVLYHRNYWDLLMPENGKAPFVDGNKKPLNKLISQLDLTNSEFEFLAAALAESNELTTLEFKAFNAVQDGLKNSHHYLQSEQHLLAISILYSNDYLLAKAQIMTYINKFLDSYDLRSAKRAESVQLQLYWSTNLVIFSFVLLVGLLLYSLYTRSQAKALFVKKLRREVANRTMELLERREQLKVIIHEMKNTKNQLVQSEKMALLGDLVGGIAHEVNTPLGLSVTLASSLQDETKQLLNKVENDKLKRTELSTYADQSIKSCQMLLANLQRASSLIRSFKLVAVDQSSEELRLFKISEYLHEVLLTLQPKLKKTQIKVNIAAPENEGEVQTYPGALAQITTNLIMNAVSHAFDDGKVAGLISFSLKYDEKNVLLEVQDNGKGMDESVCSRIFEPFFTTKRDSGGSGLGMSIVYGLVVRRLLGSIICQSEINKGTTFLLTFPMRIEPETDKLRG